ncbi:M23 family metallopeptidase [Phormidium tenue FACHB-886]|nr:M23 family metallopeptidase [Phormidium tenue FACHB-886]
MRRALISLALGAVALLSVLSSAAQSSPAQIQVSPTSPQLGDTLSIVIQADTSGTAPTVVLNQKTYPTFAIAPNRYRALVPTTPLDRPGQLTLQINGAGDPQNIALQLRDRDFPTQSIWLSGGGFDGTDYEFDKVDAFKALVTPEKLWNGAFQRPSEGEISTVYGVRRYYNGEFAQDYYHRGVDYAAATGTPVVAPAAGKVMLIGREADGFQLHGNTIGVDHGQGVSSILIHLSRIDVKEGDVVQAGQRLGAVGATGAATGPHLHWGLYVNAQSVDPVPWRYQGFQ